MKKQRMNNQGYSMVELVIVIAIIAILSVLSLVTLRAVENSKKQKAVSTLESEMTTLRTATMAQDSRMALLLYRENEASGTYYIKRGYCDSSGDFHPLSDATGENSGPSDNPNLYQLDYYDYVGVANPVTVMQRGTIAYEGEYVGADGVVIQYNKTDGSVLSGAGKIVFFDKGDNFFATVQLKKDTGLYQETYGTITIDTINNVPY